MPISAASLAALGTPQVSGLITNSRLVQAGTQGFKALSATQKLAIRALARFSIYAAIAQWGITVGLDVITIRNVAETTRVLTGFEVIVRNARQTVQHYYTKVDCAFGAMKREFENFDGKKWDPSHQTACDQNTKRCEQMKANIAQGTKQLGTWATGMKRLAQEATRNLEGLIK